LNANLTLQNSHVYGLLGRPDVRVDATASDVLEGDPISREAISLLKDVFRDVVCTFRNKVFPAAWTPVPLPRSMRRDFSNNVISENQSYSLLVPDTLPVAPASQQQTTANSDVLPADPIPQQQTTSTIDGDEPWYEPLEFSAEDLELLDETERQYFSWQEAVLSTTTRAENAVISPSAAVNDSVAQNITAHTVSLNLY
jgi:hypothetical protein